VALSEKFDTAFQSRMLSIAVQQPFFLAHYSDVFSSSIFSSMYHQEIARWLVAFYKKYKTVPSVTTMRKELRDKIKPNDPLFKGYKLIIDQIYNTEVLDHEYVKDQLVTVARFQNVKSALLRMTDLTDLGDFEALPKILNDALQVGSGAGDLGMDLRSNLEKSILMFDTLEQPISVGFKKLESYTGGFFPGELTSIIAPAGRGKTAVMGTLAYGVARNNASSFYYTLEIRDGRLLLRLYSRMAKMPVKELASHLEEARRRMKLFRLATGGTCYVKFWPSGTITIETIRSHLMKATGLGIRPVAIFIDYADLLRPSRNRDRPDLEITDMYRDMRALGSEFNLHVFTASQAKTESWHQEIIDMGDSSGSQGKEATVDSWISVNRMPGEQDAGVGRLYVGKARMEKSGRIIHVAFDLDRMTIFEIDVEDYKRRMKRHGQNTTETGRPIVGKGRKGRDDALEAHYSH
jgi:replicative DNA helicase